MKTLFRVSYPGDPVPPVRYVAEDGETREQAIERRHETARLWAKWCGITSAFTAGWRIAHGGFDSVGSTPTR